MKKALATMGILFTMIATTFTGAALPVSAHTSNTARPSNIESWIVNDEDWSDDDADYATVKGVKHFLALRSQPAYSDSNIIGKLYNGDQVIMTSRWSGDYVWVYSPDYDCHGWVNGSYLY